MSGDIQSKLLALFSHLSSHRHILHTWVSGAAHKRHAGLPLNLDYQRFAAGGAAAVLQATSNHTAWAAWVSQGMPALTGDSNGCVQLVEGWEVSTKVW
jgi:hypothetical protein